MAESKGRGITVLMLPWLGYSHVSSYLELGKRLTKRGVSVHLCSTPVNLASVKKALLNSPSIKTIEIHLPNLPELPPHYHTVNGLPPNLLSTLRKAFDMAAPNLSDIIRTLKPDLLINDIFQHWAPQVALSQNVPTVSYITNGAVTTCYWTHFEINGRHSPFPYPEIYVTDYEKAKFEKLMKVHAHGIGTAERVSSCVRESKLILVKSCDEIEGKYIDYFSTLCRKKVLPVGLLVSETVDWKQDDDCEIFEWLDKKDEASTLFVSMGTECHLSKEEVEEMASGLELSGVNFIWVVKCPDRDFIGDFLKIFRERIGEKGIILETWAPQTRILAHPSIGGFVSHCGRGSVTEALAYGVPIIAMPMQYDQPLNARVVNEAGLGAEVKRDGNGRFRGSDIAEVIKKVVVHKDGDEIRRKTKDLSKSRRESGDKYVDIVVEELLQLCNI
ncbi:hypothetical protein DCAR_0626575 [Daucus carota subsp. sativus]|uniref:Glycosyltransferase n=1 Tax=Daucus carota subsp. sativus TaxID=79200 RepID=A0AAF1B8F1_DAUCS|nr:PREDICTED: beta-D-glucosyl crocetin beta-1,6-glucosyltransferase-like [Daucus carota subsp. sativus]WOH07146.1 hypothetical protein DCAR_0626575 [Daucus carota subsp. sativus]